MANNLQWNFSGTKLRDYFFLLLCLKNIVWKSIELSDLTGKTNKNKGRFQQV